MGDRVAVLPPAGASPHASSSKRRRTEIHTYDEVHRRAPRKRKVAYLVTEGQRTGARRDSIAAGTATLERTVGQRYNWRDSGLEAAKRRRGRALFEATSAQE